VNLRWRLLIAGVVALAIALPVAIGLASRHSGTPVGSAGPSAPPLAAVSADQDRAVEAVLSAVGDRAAVAVTSAVPVRACTAGDAGGAGPGRRSSAGNARGSVFARSADLYVDPGGEDALIAAVGAALPSEYRQKRGTATGGAAAPLTAEVGGAVTLTVAQLGDGWVRATAQSDCRAGASPSTVAGSAPTQIAALLGTLGTAPDSVRATVLPCPAGGQTVTWAALSGVADSAQLQQRLSPTLPASARRFVSPANRLPWRDGHTSVVVAASDDGTHVTVQYTVDCG
jgi:hypothetical protein